jgi:release factor glutamine methyltransferase
MIKKSIGTTVAAWLRDAADELAMLGISTALLDAELLLAQTLRQSRTWLHAHGEEIIDSRRLEIATARLDLRKERVPVAYILGYKEFYGRQFKVTPSVLIPRPESEAIIESLKQHWGSKPGRLVDVGAGSGCLGITAKLELPLDVTLVDISRHALTVAEDNATTLSAQVTTQKSNLLDDVLGVFDIIIANLPYVDKGWERSPETAHEPELALFAEDRGMALIKRLIGQAGPHLKAKGLLLLEADPEQHTAIIDYAKNRGFSYTAVNGYCIVLGKD